MIKIIKYPNRKFYQEMPVAKYLTLNHVLDMVKDGKTVQVIERDYYTPTGAPRETDITTEVLRKFLLRQEELSISKLNREELQAKLASRA